MGRISWREL